uniref:Uncharacterized protein n=1 Tax=Knipowitschia caucasica TaxID=637954 RepID=A0AAV2JU31_KNICA
MNTNDAKEYLARREIPQLFEGVHADACSAYNECPGPITALELWSGAFIAIVYFCVCACSSSMDQLEST